MNDQDGPFLPPPGWRLLWLQPPVADLLGSWTHPWEQILRSTFDPQEGSDEEISLHLSFDFADRLARTWGGEARPIIAQGRIVFREETMRIVSPVGTMLHRLSPLLELLDASHVSRVLALETLPILESNELAKPQFVHGCLAFRIVEETALLKRWSHEFPFDLA